MSSAVAHKSLARFIALVELRLGIHYDTEQWSELSPLLVERSTSRGADGYLEWLGALPSSHAEWKVLAERLTVGETYFLRHPTQLETLVEQVLPSFLRHSSSIRVLCAGCSSGEEPYSVSLLSREHGRVDGSRLQVTGIDVNPRAIARARAARYSPWSLRSVPSALRERWFLPSPEGFALRPELCDRVGFEERNLLEEAPAFWAPGSFHVILCRNVVLYFPTEVTRKIIARMAQSLVPGGYLFLGPSETLRGISEDFELLRQGDVFYYRLRSPASSTSLPVVGARSSSSTSLPVVGARASPSSTSLPAVGAARTPVPTLRAASIEVPAVDGLEGVLLLLDAERYGEAWARLESMPEATQPKAQLLRGVLHLHAGRLEEAERVGKQLVGVSATETAAQFLLGLCREQSGDEVGARSRYAAAVRADPTFALGHLRAGSLARRAGAVAEARVALRMSLSLLPQEKPLFLSLFGGGFGRHGLMQVGLRELQACTENS